VTEDGVDAVILAGAPLTGLAARIAEAVPVPLIDPLSAALGQAQVMVRLGVKPPRAGRFARPPAKPATGFAPSLRRWIERRNADDDAC
jgi:Asp/Glu/hydantoin racemase